MPNPADMVKTISVIRVNHNQFVCNICIISINNAILTTVFPEIVSCKTEMAHYSVHAAVSNI